MLRNNRASNSNQVPPRTQQRLQNRSHPHTSLLQHIKETWPAVLIGSIGLLSGMSVIVWNEARAIQTSKSLEESISAVTEIIPDAPINSEHFGKPIYMTGTIMVQEPLTEIEYGVSVLAVKLKRRVQMYQWVEEESSFADSNGEITDTSYYYYTDWKDRIVDSSAFASSVTHWNPKEFPIKSQTQVNENVKIGNYVLGYDLKNKFSDYVEITSDERPERRDIKLHSGLYYHAQDIWNPEVGDVRIQFSYAGQHGQIVTIVGQLDSTNTIVPYKTKLGLDILLLRLGSVSIEDVFAQEHVHNRFITWLYRGGAWFLLYLGCVCLTNLLNIIVYRSRFLRDFLPNTNSSLKMTVSMSVFLCVTAMAWMWYRPMLGMSLVGAILVLLFVTKNVSEDRPNRNEYSRL